MANERTSVIKIGKKEYELLLTTRATREIGEKFGGLDKVGTKLAEAKDASESLSLVVWLVVLLANQSILRSNLETGESKPVLTEEQVEILTSPADLNSYADAILECLVRGTKRDVQGEEDPKK